VRVQPPDAAVSSARAAARALRYWTPARMRSAVPLDGIRQSAGETIPTPSFSPVAEPTAQPFAVNGRVFVRQGKERGFCSGTAINSPSRRLVLTAGHCVNSGPVDFTHHTVWSQSLVFVPAYTGGTAPFGTFVAQRGKVFALKPWLRQGNPDFDMGAFLVEPNAAGVNVADAVGGGATIALGRTRHQRFQTFGYPGESTRMQTCASPFTGDDRLTYPLGGPPTMAIRCHWLPGASGGGWMIEGTSEIDGITTYGHQRDAVHTYSPYFAKGNIGKLTRGL
jgi:V8-like Glu-specific endopeptidase